MKLRPPPPRPQDLRQVRALFTDVDGTLTTDGRLRSSTVLALEALEGRGLRLVLVTGRPAGWAECWARTLPVEGVICENGGAWFVRGKKGLLKRYAEGPERPANRRKLCREVASVLARFPGAKLSLDSVYTEVDLAVDHAEQKKLPMAQVDALEQALRARGLFAVRSSVHINCWVGAFDKASTARRYLEEEVGWRVRPFDPRVLYAGDSFNDAPMFAAFRSVGVANLWPLWERLAHRPQFVTRAREGQGFEELSRTLLRATKEHR